MQTQSEILDIPADILNVFVEAAQSSGFTDVLSKATYPPVGRISIPGDPEGENFRLKKRQNSDCGPNATTPALIEQSIEECNGGNATFTTALDYLTSTRPCFSPYNIVYNCTNAPDINPYVNYFNDPGVRKAIHAPNKTFEDCNITVYNTLYQELVEPPAYNIMPAILAANISIHIYSGDYDFLLNHFGSELAIQNMTWNGEQGLRSKPDNPFLVDGVSMGNWGYEVCPRSTHQRTHSALRKLVGSVLIDAFSHMKRGLSYHHILKAGHAAPYDQPKAMFAFVRDFVVGTAGYNGTLA